VVDENGFTILKSHGKVPVLATCLRCQLKFLTPSGLKDAESAVEYLRTKYDSHKCLNRLARREPQVGTVPPTKAESKQVE
jgi:hypothetical protein